METMDEIDGKRVGQCPYCGYQLVRAGNESPGVNCDGKHVVVRDLFLACPHCGYRGPIAATWAEAMKKHELQEREKDLPELEIKRQKAIENFRVKIIAEIEKILKQKNNMKPEDGFQDGTPEKAEYMRAFAILNSFKVLAIRGNGWRELVDELS